MVIKGFPDLLNIKPAEAAKPKMLSEVKPDLAGKINFNKDTFEISGETRKLIQEKSVSPDSAAAELRSLTKEEIEPLEMPKGASAKEIAAAQEQDFRKAFDKYYKQLQRSGLTDRTPLANAFNAKLGSDK